MTGRFAPSPTGPLHFGSMIAAVASFLDARSMGGQWLVRIEDLDTPRNQPGAVDAILRALEAFALEWDGSVVFQSRRLALYQEALEKLLSEVHAYPCACSRKEAAENGRYSGACRAGLAAGRTARSTRVRVDAEPIRFEDRLQGEWTERLTETCGDFVIARADGFFAYQLAVVVDDAAQEVTHVVRGSDLLDSTARQIHLQRLLGLRTPQYLHVPVALGADGAKLSKQTGAKPADPANAAVELTRVLRFLELHLPAEMQKASCREQLAWATQEWSAALLPRTAGIFV